MKYTYQTFWKNCNLNKKDINCNVFGVKNYLKTFELVYLRTEFLLLESETFNKVKCGIF